MPAVSDLLFCSVSMYNSYESYTNHSKHQYLYKPSSKKEYPAVKHTKITYVYFS